MTLGSLKPLVEFANGLTTFVRSALNGLKSCKLCWRITIGIFFVFVALNWLLVELAVQRYERQQFPVLEREALVVARTIIRAVDADGNTERIAKIGPHLRDNSVLVGMERFTETGRPVDRFSEATTIRPDTENFVEEERQVVYTDMDRMELVWPPSRVHAPYFVSGLIDISRVDGLVREFEDQVLMYMPVLAAIATVLTMLLLDYLILRPVRALDAGLRRTAPDCAGLRRLADDPNGSLRDRLETTGKDEIGAIARHFHTLNRRLTATTCDREGSKKNGFPVNNNTQTNQSHA